MSSDEPVVPHADPSSARLVGWKEISAYLRRSIRTVQRWECESNLPVRRYPTRRGEGVFALREELDAWLKSTPGAAATAANGDYNGNGSRDGKEDVRDDGNGHAAATAVTGDTAQGSAAEHPSELQGAATLLRRRISPVFVSTVVFTFIVVAAFLSVVFEVFGGGPPPSPAAARVVGEDIVAFDAVGKLLWKYSLDRSMRTTTDPDRELVVEDLDGDGRREVVMSVVSQAPPLADSVICLDANGTKRWSRRPDRRAQYGHGPMAPPWVPLFVKSTGAPGHRSLWVSWGNSPFFGSFVERLDVKTGEPTAVYWSAGYIKAMAITELRGRPVLLLGACHHGPAGASLAAYDLGVTAASAPAIEPKFTCLDCPAGRPLAFYLFPKTALSRAVTAENEPLVASSINVTETSVIVNVLHAPNSMPEANAIYTFDRNLQLADAETIGTYRTAHRELERQGKLTAPYSQAEERELFPVLSWDGGRFVPITK